MARIALVDDDRNILTSVSMTLEAEGFEVETFNDGQSALDAFNRRMPDMAVLDIKMPRMDGMDLLQRLRQKSTMPVIFLTSKDDEIDEVLGLRMGADDYVKNRSASGFWSNVSALCCAAMMRLPPVKSPSPKKPRLWSGVICAWTRCGIRWRGKAAMSR